MRSFFKIAILMVVYSTYSFAGDPEVMTCPQSENIRYVDGHYEASELHKGWEGVWLSQPHKKGEISGFTVAEYLTLEKSKTGGTLTNCTYKLSKLDDVVDLEYHEKKDEKKLRTLIVSIENQPNWFKEEGQIGIQGYECKKSASECKFIPIELAE